MVNNNEGKDLIGFVPPHLKITRHTRELGPGQANGHFRFPSDPRKNKSKEKLSLFTRDFPILAFAQTNPVKLEKMEEKFRFPGFFFQTAFKKIKI